MLYENFNNSNFCVYVFLNPSKPGSYKYNDIEFQFEPIYVGKGKINRPKNHLFRYKNGKSYFYNKLKKIIGQGHEPMLMGHEGYGKGIPRTDDVKNKIRNSVSGEKNHFYGKTHSDELKKKMSDKNSGKNNPNSKVYIIKHINNTLRFEGRLELKEYLNDYNTKFELKGPNRVSFDSLINNGKSKDFEIISIEKP